MGSCLFALNAVLPIILMVAIGYFLKKIGFIVGDMAAKMNKLVFRVFLPVMIFLNIYNIEGESGLDAGFVIYAVVAVLAVFIVAIPAVMLITKRPESRGALLQGAFRSYYTLIGIPLAQSLFGDEGGAVASLLLAVGVPLFNVLAVVSLSIFGGAGERVSVKKILLGILKNPLIHGVLIGTSILVIKNILVSQGITFDLYDVAPLAKVLTYLSSLATPLALLVLGAQFEFLAVSALRREIISGTLIRAFIVPFAAIGVAYIFFRDRFDGAQFAALVAMFATPVAVSSVPMAQEMGADVTLAGQLVVWTTVLSAFTVFLISFGLSMLGIFPTV